MRTQSNLSKVAQFFSEYCNPILQVNYFVLTSLKLINLYIQRRMEGRKQALLLWLQSAARRQIRSINEIRDCKMLQGLLSQIEGFTFQTTQSSSIDWKDNYTKLRSIYDQLSLYMKEVLKIPPPSNLSIMNLVEMAKGQSEEDLQTLINLIFIVCILCPIKEGFIRCIMELPENAQIELMQIFKECEITKEQDKQEDSELGRYKQEIARIEYQYQNLTVQNTSLRAVLEDDAERVRKNEELVKVLTKENQNLMRELSEKNQMIRLRQQNFLDKYAQHNQDIVEELKKTLLEREQGYNQQIFMLKQKIQQLTESLLEVKKSNSELLEEQQKKSIIQSRDQHMNCISIEKHKVKINELLSMSKDATQKEMNLKLENIKIKNTLAEYEAKNRKMMEQLRKKQNEFLVNSEDGNKLKIQFFTRIRDSLKSKLIDYKSKENRNFSGNKIDFQDD